MRPLILVPLTLLVTAGVGVGAMKIAGIEPHLRAMLMAAGICLIAGELGAAVLMLAGKGDQLAVSQAGMVGMSVHLLAAIAMAGGLVLTKMVQPGFIYWLLVFYWITLIVLVVMFVKAVKRAPVASMTPRQ